MDGDNRKRELDHELLIWQQAGNACNDKLSVLERLCREYRGSDMDLMEMLVGRERDLCAQLRNRIAVKLSERVQLDTGRQSPS